VGINTWVCFIIKLEMRTVISGSVSSGLFSYETFVVLTAVKIQVEVFCVVTLSDVVGYRRFGRGMLLPFSGSILLTNMLFHSVI
jgi:hypothetical protein